MNFITFSVYIWFGNKLTMSKLMIVTIYFTNVSVCIGMLDGTIQALFRVHEVF